VQAVRALPDPQAIPPGAQKKAAEIAADAQARIGKLNKDLADKLAKAGESFVGAASTTAQAYVDKGLPLYALRFLARAESSFGGSRALAELRGKLAQASAVDTRRWRRFPLEPKLAGWEGSDDFTLEVTTSASARKAAASSGRRRRRRFPTASRRASRRPTRRRPVSPAGSSAPTTRTT